MNYYKILLLIFIFSFSTNNFVYSKMLTLKNQGALLGRVSSKDLKQPFSIIIKLNGDIPLATYVTARFQNNQPKQRLSNGIWVNWNEKSESLQNNGFVPNADDNLIFKILDENINSSFLPLIITISYLDHKNLKSGYYIVDQ